MFFGASGAGFLEEDSASGFCFAFLGAGSGSDWLFLDFWLDSRAFGMFCSDSVSTCGSGPVDLFGSSGAGFLDTGFGFFTSFGFVTIGIWNNCLVTASSLS